MKTSVCMATYNGMQWLAQQIESIQSQTVAVDEWVFVDDCSSDGTFEYLQTLDLKNKVLISNDQNCGVIKSFEKALIAASGEIIFLCDQDDLWYPEKIAEILRVFEFDAAVDVVISDADIIDDQGDRPGVSFYENRAFKSSLAANLIKNRFHGCSMAMKKNFLSGILPFPE